MGDSSIFVEDSLSNKIQALMVGCRMKDGGLLYKLATTGSDRRIDKNILCVDGRVQRVSVGHMWAYPPEIIQVAVYQG